MFGLGKSKQIVGLDIGSSSVKAVELKRSGKGISLLNLGMESLPQEMVVDGAIVDAGAVSNTITQIFTDRKIKTKNVATSVSGHSVIVKRLTMAGMSEADLQEAIQMEAAQHIPFDIAEVNMDYQVMEGDETTANMDVLLVAAKKDKILNYTYVLSMSSRTPAVVDIDAFAMQNAYEFNYEPEIGTTVALLNIGASVMNINLVRGQTPLFVRDVSVGGNQYTDSLTKELDLTFEDAERVKMGRSVPGVSDEARLPVLKSVSEIIILEIQKTLDYFRSTAGGEQIRKIYVAGGSARVTGLLDLLKDEFSIPVEELNPFLKINYDAAGPYGEIINDNSPRLAVAVGLALRSFETL
jgi:type IV pilus assembly protein PilM